MSEVISSRRLFASVRGAALRLTRRVPASCAVAMLACSVSAWRGAVAQTPATQRDDAAHAGTTPRPGGELKVGELKLSIPDLELLDQDGRRVRFYSDLIKGKVVVLSFFYTSCEYVCAMQGRNFSQLQRKLGGRLGRDVYLLLLTRDPAVDTPRRLKEWGAKYGAGPGWTLLTGRPEDVGRLIATFTGDRLGASEAHSSGVYIGNDAARAWTYTSGLAPPDALVESIERLLKSAPIK